jgi:hypothetical protein
MKAWRFELVAAVVFVLVGAATAATPPQQSAGGLPTEADSYIRQRPEPPELIWVQLTCLTLKTGLLRSLEEQRAEYARRRGLAMPLAGSMMWALIGIAGAFLPPILAVWSLFIGTALIAYLGMALSRFTGENFLNKNRPKNTFDSLFFHCVAMALLVYAIAIPFFRVDYTSLPLTVGILAGLMWVPLSWIIQHWVGIFHAVARTILVTAAWYVAPHHRFVVIPAVIVGVYGVTMVILQQRWRAVSRNTASDATT